MKNEIIKLIFDVYNNPFAIYMVKMPIVLNDYINNNSKKISGDESDYLNEVKHWLIIIRDSLNVNDTKYDYEVISYFINILIPAIINESKQNQDELFIHNIRFQIHLIIKEVIFLSKNKNYNFIPTLLKYLIEKEFNKIEYRYNKRYKLAIEILTKTIKSIKDNKQELKRELKPENINKKLN